MFKVVRWLGYGSGAMSLFFLAQRAWGFGLAAVLEDLRAFYVAIFHPLADLFAPIAMWLAASLGLGLPDWWREVAVLYMAMGAAMSRASYFFTESSKRLERLDVKTEGLFRRSDEVLEQLGAEPPARADGPYSNLDDAALARKLCAVRIAEWFRLVVLLPLYVLGWPVFWVVDLVRHALGMSLIYVRRSVHEFGKVVLGMFIFIALNAGLQVSSATALGMGG